MFENRWNTHTRDMHTIDTRYSHRNGSQSSERKIPRIYLQGSWHFRGQSNLPRSRHAAHTRHRSDTYMHLPPLPLVLIPRPSSTSYSPRPLLTVLISHLGSFTVASEKHRTVVAARLGAPKHGVRHAPGERLHGEAVFDAVPPRRRRAQRANSDTNDNERRSSSG